MPDAPEPLKRPSLAQLKERCFKHVHEARDSALVYRPISIRLTWLLVRTPLTPNGATTLGLLAGLGGMAAMAWAEGWWALVGVLLFELAVVFDHVDGEIARAKVMQSPGGHFYDSAVLEITLNIGLYAALPWMVWRQTGTDAWIAIGFVLLLLKGVNVAMAQYRGVMTLRDERRKSTTERTGPQATGQTGGPSLGTRVGALVWGIKNSVNMAFLVVAIDYVLRYAQLVPYETGYGAVNVTGLWVLAAGALLFLTIAKDLWAGSRGNYQVEFPKFK